MRSGRVNEGRRREGMRVKKVGKGRGTRVEVREGTGRDSGAGPVDGASVCHEGVKGVSEIVVMGGCV